MRTAEEWTADMETCGPYGPHYLGWVESIQRDAIEAAAKVCDEQAARARRRDNESAADECDTCWRRIRALLPAAADTAEKPEGR